MGWKRIEFGRDACARGLPEGLIASFREVFAAAGAPGNAALFETTDNGGVTFYFSPGAAALFEATLQALGPKRANAPPATARLAVGEAGIWGRA